MFFYRFNSSLTSQQAVSRKELTFFWLLKRANKIAVFNFEISEIDKAQRVYSRVSFNK